MKGKVMGTGEKGYEKKIGKSWGKFQR